MIRINSLEVVAREGLDPCMATKTKELGGNQEDEADIADSPAAVRYIGATKCGVAA